MEKQSKIYNRRRAKQLVDFKGLQYGAVMPTDIDGFIEFDNRLFIIIEAKYNNAKLPYGQRLALERLCDAANEQVHSFALIVSHNHPPGEAIDLAEARAMEYRWNGTWFPIHKQATCVDFVDAMRERFLV